MKHALGNTTLFGRAQIATTTLVPQQPIDNSSPCFHQEKQIGFDQVEQLVRPAVNAYLHRSGEAALSIGIYQRGYFYCFNYGELSKEIPKTPTSETLYEIGSITKTFTGILLAYAIEEGKLEPEDDIRKYLPGKFPNLAYDGHPIRIMDLADQTSGLPQNSTQIPNGATPDQNCSL